MKVFVLVYKEYEGVMANDSAHTKLALEALHENVQVLRHPGSPA